MFSFQSFRFANVFHRQLAQALHFTVNIVPVRVRARFESHPFDSLQRNLDLWFSDINSPAISGDEGPASNLKRGPQCGFPDIAQIFSTAELREGELLTRFARQPKLTETASPAPLSFRRRRFASQSSCAMRSADEAVRLAPPYVSCSSRQVHHVQEQEVKPAAPQQRQSSLIP